MGSSSLRIRGENEKNVWVATTQNNMVCQSIQTLKNPLLLSSTTCFTPTSPGRFRRSRKVTRVYGREVVWATQALGRVRWKLRNLEISWGFAVKAHWGWRIKLYNFFRIFRYQKIKTMYIPCTITYVTCIYIYIYRYNSFTAVRLGMADSTTFRPILPHPRSIIHWVIDLTVRSQKCAELIGLNVMTLHH